MNKYPKIVLISIDNFNTFHTNEPILNFKIQDWFGHIETEIYESIHLILDNITHETYNIDKEIKKFILFLKGTNLEELEHEYKGDEKYMAALRTVAELSTDPEMAGYYNREDAIEQDKKDCYEYGVMQGIEQTKLETVKNLLNVNVLNLEQIAEATKLSIEDIKKIQAEQE